MKAGNREACDSGELLQLNLLAQKSTESWECVYFLDWESNGAD